jgi:hypothetical protein
MVAVEHPAGIDPAFHHIGEEFVDIGACRCRTAGNDHVAVEHLLRALDCPILWHSDASHGATGTNDRHRRVDRLLGSDALEHRPDAEAAR